MSSLRALLARLSPDVHKKGNEFELLVKWFLENEPEYKALLKKVYRWNSSPHRWGKDTGIDLTAEGRDGKLWAIQAKAYAADYYVTKHDVDKFLSEAGRQPSGRRAFEVRLLVATTDCLGANARHVLDDTPGARRLLLADLEKASVTWPRAFSDLRPAKIKPATAKPYQRVAIREVVKGFRSASRGQLLMACGTGKTLTALWIAERLKARRVLVLVPSLSLVRQTLASWYAHGKHTPPYQVVCSDESVHKGEDGDDLVSTASELPYPVTTDPRELATFLRGRGHRYVFSTYHSSPQIAAAFTKHRDLAPFDLILADEAHRVAGAPDAAFATILDGEAIRAKRRLFMTATPRYATGRLIKEARQEDIEIASMDDEAQFGRVFHRLTFSDAIRRKLLTDYQVAIVVVDDEMHREHAEQGAFVTLDGKRVDARTLACQLGLARGMRNFDLRKVVSFHSRVKWAAAFAGSFSATVSVMPPSMRPSGDLWCRHVSGAQSTRDRDTELTALKELDAGTRGLIANARCLTEGVDVPALDGIAFIDPRRSEVDVVQAVGRAIRKADNKKVGTIVIPVFVGKRADAINALETSAFKPVWQVLQALRAHDDMLASELDELRRQIGRRGTTGKLPAKIKVIGAREVGADFLTAFDTQLVEHTTASWEFWFGLLGSYVEKNGDARVRLDHETEDGLRLGGWVVRQRSLRKSGQLSSARIKRLDGFTGWTWDTDQDAWETGFKQLRVFVAKHRHARVPSTYVTKSRYPLGSWANTQRIQQAKQLLSQARQDRLEGLPGWLWTPKEQLWEDGYEHLLQFVVREGHARVPVGYAATDGYKLGAWVVQQRSRAGNLKPERRKRLDTVDGWTWTLFADAWEEGFRRLQEFIKSRGHARVPALHRDSDGFRLGAWVNQQRTKRLQGTLLLDREERLTQTKGWVWDVLTDAWEDGLRHLQEFIKTRGHARVAALHRAPDGFRLGAWVRVQRRLAKEKKLSQDRAKRLAALNGWSWDVLSDAWEEGFQKLLAFTKATGHARVPADYVARGGFRLGIWVNHQRVFARRAELNPHRIKRLTEVKGWTWNARLHGG